MSELRWDPIKQRWCVISIERARRPHDFKRVDEETTRMSICPFDTGNEDKTPPEIFAIRPISTKHDTPGWKTRVVANRFPAFRIEGNLDRQGEGLYDRMNGIGAHEVVIENPDHSRSLADLNVDEIVNVLLAYQQRLNDLRNDPRFRYILIFKNHKPQAGASLEHSHTQIIATPITPLITSQELNAGREHFKKKERCLFCDILKQELETGQRVIRENEDFVAFAPYASAFPFETWLYPKPRNHLHDFGSIPGSQLANLATILKDTLMRLKVLLDDPPYNFVIQTSPISRPRPGRPDYWETIKYDYHWHLEIIPRLTMIAGFEWGTGFYINTVPPENAAKYLREVTL